MTFSSVLIERLIFICHYIQKSYQKSYVKWIIERAFNSISALFDKSLIVLSFSSWIRDHSKDDESSIIWEKIREVKEKLSDRLSRISRSSAIVRQLTEKHIDVYMLIALITFAPFIPTTLTILLSIVTIIVAKIKMTFRKSDFKYSKIYLFLYSLFIIALLIGAVFNLNLSLGIGSLVMYLSSICLGLMVPYVLDSKKKLKVLLNGLAFTLLLVSLHGIYQKLVGVPVDPAWIDAKYGKDTVRIYSVFENPNVYGEYLILVVPIVFALFSTARRPVAKALYLGIMLLGILNVFLTLSRASLIGLFLAIFLIVILIARQYMPFLLIALAASPFILPEYMIERVLSIVGRSAKPAVDAAASSNVDTSIAYRGSIYGSSFSMIKDNYLTGIGLGQFREVYKNYSVAKSFHAHNTFLMIIIEGGMLAIISFISLGIVWSKKMISTIKVKNGLMSFAAVSAFAAIAGCSVQGLADHIWHNYDIMFMYFMMIGIGYSSYYLAGEKQ